VTFKMEFWSLLTYPAVPYIQMHVLLLVVGGQSRNKTSWRSTMHWSPLLQFTYMFHIPYKMLNLSVNLRNGTLLVFVDDFVTFLHFSHKLPVEWQSECWHVSMPLSRENHSKVFSPGQCHPKLCEHFMHCWCSCHGAKCKSKCDTLSNKPLENHRLHLTFWRRNNFLNFSTPCI